MAIFRGKVNGIPFAKTTDLNQMRLRLLRMFLGFAAVTWGVSIFGIFISWPTAASALQGLGAQPIAYDPMLDYWLRMAAGAFTLIGVWYVVLMIRPTQYWPCIPWFGLIMVVEGLILLFHGFRLHLPPFPFYSDTAACVLIGCGIIYCAPAAKPK